MSGHTRTESDRFGFPPPAGSEIYRDDWLIYCDPPPIPYRHLDWTYIHKDFDGPEDTRGGRAASPEACKAEIDELLEDE